MREPDLPRELGTYLLLHRLGRGGMGDVYLAKQAGIEGIEHYCVIKSIRPDRADAEATGRFIDEAAVLVNLNHRNICQVSRVGRAGDELFVAMELIAGRHLGEVLTWMQRAEELLPEELALLILCETLAALDYAHRLSHPVTGEAMHIVHRDVSPQNVMLSYEGDLKLIDFGLAASSLKKAKTQGGIRVGKVAYMAPEQVRSEPVDERTDQYAAAVLGYELLSNRRFYSGLEGDALWRAVGEGGYQPVTWTSLDAGLQRVLGRALSPAPDRRYPSCGVFRKELLAEVKRRGLIADTEDLRQLMTRLFPSGPAEQRALLQRYQDVRPPDPDQAGDFEDISSASHQIPATVVGMPPVHESGPTLDEQGSTEVLLQNPDAPAEVTGGHRPAPAGFGGGVPHTPPTGDDLMSPAPSADPADSFAEETELVGRPPPDGPPPTSAARRRGWGLFAAGLLLFTAAVAGPLLWASLDAGNAGPPASGRGEDDAAAEGPLDAEVAVDAAPGDQPALVEDEPVADDAVPALDEAEPVADDADPVGDEPAAAAAQPVEDDDEPAASEAKEEPARAHKASRDRSGRRKARRARHRRPDRPRPRPTDDGAKLGPPPVSDPVTLKDDLAVLSWCRPKERCAPALLRNMSRGSTMAPHELRDLKASIKRCARKCLR